MLYKWNINMKTVKLICGFKDTRKNNEDFSLTPYLFCVYSNDEKKIKVYGLGICWGYYSVFLCLATGTPKGYPFLSVLPN